MANSYVSRAFPLRKLPLLLGLAWGSAAWAQTAAAPALKEVVVSASRSEQDKDDVPATIEVIDQKKLEELQIRDLRDIARDLPNVSVKRAPVRFTLAGTTPAGREGDAGFNIRGLEGNRVLMLVDGIRTPRSYVFAANNFGRDYFDLGLTERIEVVKGPASALYGSDGMGGLVNFISTEPADLIKPGASLGGRATVGYSDDDKSTNAGVTIAGKAQDNLQWLLAANIRTAYDLTNMGTNDSANTNRTKPNPQQDRTSSVLGKLVMQSSADAKHVLTLEHVERRSNVNVLSSLFAVTPTTPLAAASIIGQTAYSTAQRDRLTWDATLRTNWAAADTVKVVVSTQTAKSREFVFEDRYTSADRERDVTYDENTQQFNLQGDKVIRMGGDWAQKLTYGVDYAVARVYNLQNGVTPPAGETFPLKRFPDTRETTSAVYLQDELIGGAWSITPGVRFDSFALDADQTGFNAAAKSLSGNASSPKLGVLFRVTPQWSVFGNYAAGFKAPNAFQVNNFFENVQQGYKTIPNPNLKPESSQNFELGLRGRLGNVSLDLAAFDGRYTDFIENDVQVGGTGAPGDPIVFQSVNLTKASISGFEFKLDWAMGKLGDGTLSSSLAYGESRGRDDSTGKPIDSIDPAKLNVGLKYRTNAWDLRLDVTNHAAKDRSDISTTTQFATPAATTVDLGGQWRIRKNLRLNAAINNVADEKYWRWTDVRGQATTSTTLDAYTQTGCSAQASLVFDF